MQRSRYEELPVAMQPARATCTHGLSRMHEGISHFGDAPVTFGGLDGAAKGELRQLVGLWSGITAPN